MDKFNQCAEDIKEAVLDAELDIIRAERLIRVLERMITLEEDADDNIILSDYFQDRLSTAVEAAQAVKYSVNQIINDIDSIERKLVENGTVN